jgi:RNA recognition motif-containing protein
MMFVKGGSIDPTKKHKAEDETTGQLYIMQRDDLKPIKRGSAPPDRKKASAQAVNSSKKRQLHSLLDSHQTARDPAKNESSTHLFVVNVSPKLDLLELCEEFGRYGPLVSVDIQDRPVSAGSRQRRGEGRLAFIGYMRAEDALIARERMDGKYIGGQELRVGWAPVSDFPPTDLSQPIYG